MNGSDFAHRRIVEPRSSVLVTAPAVEPVDIGFVKASLEIDYPDRDEQIAVWISAARERFESVLGRAIVQQVRECRIDRFFPAIRLPMPQHADDAIVSVKYLDGQGTDQTLDPGAYRLTGAGSFEGAVLRPVYAGSWPLARQDADAVRIRFTCGYPPSSADLPDYRANVPACIKTAIAAFVGNLLERRESQTAASLYEVPDQCWDLIRDLRVSWVA